jgi:hypothetical protein
MTIPLFKVSKNYPQEGANVLFFTFINPATMEVPLAFQKLGNRKTCMTHDYDI